MTLVLDAELQDAARAPAHASRRRCAERIVALLERPRCRLPTARIRAWARLRPADIAVLVRTGREAAAVRQALRRRGVASVYLSDKDSVLRSDEAQDLLRLLRAVASPLDARLVRAALATRLARAVRWPNWRGWPTTTKPSTLRSEQLRQLHAVWQGQGVLAMLRQALHRLDLPARWLAVAEAPGDASRRARRSEASAAANAASPMCCTWPNCCRRPVRGCDGEQALIRWLAEQMQGEGASGDEQIVRLESDADLVQVDHRAQGQGPGVPAGLPALRLQLPRRRQVAHPLPERGRRRRRRARCTCSVNDELLAAADKDRLREDLRLLYVALTRARHALWLGVAALTAGREPRMQRAPQCLRLPRRRRRAHRRRGALAAQVAGAGAGRQRHRGRAGAGSRATRRCNRAPPCRRCVRPRPMRPASSGTGPSAASRRWCARCRGR